MRHLFLLALVLLISSCTYTTNYMVVYFETGALAEKARVEVNSESQFSTSKTVSPATELSVPLLKEMERQLKETRELKERELTK